MCSSCMVKYEDGIQHWRCAGDDREWTPEQIERMRGEGFVTLKEDLDNRMPDPLPRLLWDPEYSHMGGSVSPLVSTYSGDILEVNENLKRAFAAVMAAECNARAS